MSPAMFGHRAGAAIRFLVGLPLALLLICGRPSAVRHILNNGVGPVLARGR